MEHKSHSLKFLDALNGGGWGNSPNHYSSRWLGFLSTGTLDSLVRTGHCTVYCPVHAMSANCWGLEQLTVEFDCPCGALDSPVAHRTVRSS
jgi:hypothetical protein